jgi:hypothetical protein
MKVDLKKLVFFWKKGLTYSQIYKQDIGLKSKHLVYYYIKKLRDEGVVLEKRNPGLSKDEIEDIVNFSKDIK